MAVDLIKKDWKTPILEVTIGATAEDGGTRTSTVTVGGESALPFLHFEGVTKHRPIVGMEVSDRFPTNWPDNLKNAYGDVLGDPVRWAQKCEELGADLICLHLDSADPDGDDVSGEKVAQTVQDVLGAVGLPLAIIGCGNAEKDNEIMRDVAEAAKGERCLLGIAEQENYKSLVGSCMLGNHNIIARSPIDVNICKQLNILISDMGLEATRIVIDPVVSSLGYGMEYSYSVIERIRLGALRGDRMLAMPMICTVGPEAWRVKEAYVGKAELPAWGDENTRGVMWEAVSAASYLQSGADIVVLRHPGTIKLVKDNIEELVAAAQ